MFFQLKGKQESEDGKTFTIEPLDVGNQNVWQWVQFKFSSLSYKNGNIISGTSKVPNAKSCTEDEFSDSEEEKAFYKSTI